MKKTNKYIFGLFTLLVLGAYSLKSQTVDLNDAKSSGEDEIKAALKVEQRNYDNLASMLKEATSAAQYNNHFQESWLRWIDSRVQEIGKQPNKVTSSEKLLGYIRNRSEQLNGLVEESNQNKNALLSQGQLDRAQILTASCNLMVENLLKNLTIADYPIDVHPEEAIKNNEGLKKIEDAEVDFQVMSGSSDEVYNKYLMKNSGIADIDMFIKAARNYTPGKTKKEDVRKDISHRDIESFIYSMDDWMFVLRGVNMKKNEGAMAYITFDKTGVLKKVKVTKSSSGKDEVVFDSDNKGAFQAVETDQSIQNPSLDKKNSDFNFQLNLPKKIALLLQEGDSIKLIEVLQKNLAMLDPGDVRNEQLRFYNLIFLARLEIEVNNIKMATLYANMADDMLKNKSAFKPADVCLKDIYLSKVRICNGDQKGAEDALSQAIKLFSEKMDIGYPVSEHQSPLLAGIVTDLCTMASRFQNIEYFKTNLSILNDAIMRLVTTPEDNLSSPGEQLFLDSYKAVLIYSEVLLKSGKYKEAIRLVDDCIISSYRRQNRYNDFSKESVYYLDALQIKSLSLKFIGDDKMAKNVLEEWMNNYKKRWLFAIFSGWVEV